MRLLLMALALPLVEIALFVLVGGWIGVLPVLALVVLSALAGVALIRSTGPATMRRVQAAMRGRENPLAAAGSAAFRVVAGLLLVVPGFFTDAVALLLLVPPVQAALLARAVIQAHSRRRSHDQVIEGEAQEVDGMPEPDRSPGESPRTRH